MASSLERASTAPWRHNDGVGATRREARRRGDGVGTAQSTPSPRRLHRDGPQNPKSKTNHDTEHRLVLEVHARGPGLDHELRELHDGREAPVAGVAVRDDRRQVVDVLPTRKRPAVVVLQGLEELVDLLGDLRGTYTIAKPSP